MARNTRRNTTPADTTPADTTPTTTTTEDTVSTDTTTTPADTSADTTTGTEAAVVTTDTDTPAEVPAGTDTDTDTPDPTPADPTDTFRAAWSVAMEAADPTTGTVPEAPLAGVVSTFRAMPRGKRDGMLLAVTTEATAGAMAAGVAGGMVAMLTASSSLAEACRAAGTAPAVPVVTPADRLLALAVAMVGITPDHAATLATLLGVTPDTLTEAATLAGADPTTDEAAVVTRARAAGRAVTGKPVRTRAAGTGTRRASSGAGRSTAVPDHVREVLTAAGVPMKVGAIAKASSSIYPDGNVSPGAVDAAVSRGIEGVLAVTVDGRKGATLAA